MITRKLGGVLRGKATPFQLVAACVLGAMLGFGPSLQQGPALYVFLIGALLVVNANLGLALMLFGVMKVLALLAVPVSFSVGRFLLDGPTSGIARAIVNAPVLAWCGLEYYAVAGGQLVGLVAGLVTGLAFARTVGGFRRRMVAAKDNPTRLHELAARPWARFLLWLFFGGTGKKDWDEKLAKRVGNPIRIWGAALMAALLAGGWLVHTTLAGPLARYGLQAGLEQANGATVDVGAAELDLGEGRLAVSSLALADPNALDRDLFSAGHLAADVDQADLLRRRVHVARIVVSEAHSGTPREHPGERLAPAAVEEEVEAVEKGPNDYSLEEVVAEYDVWKERLAQARRWMESLSGQPEETDEVDEETYADRLKREVSEKGWLSVQAGHLIDQAPTFRVTELLVEGFEAVALPGHTFDLRGSELSTHPRLVEAAPRVELATRDGAIGFVFDLAPASKGGGDGALRFHWKGLSVDDTLARLELPGGPPMRGGTLDLEIDGGWDQGRIGFVDLPLRATFHDTTLAVGKMDPTAIDELVLPIGLKGPIDAPRIHFETAALTDALIAAGKRELANQISEKTGELQEKLDEELGEELDKLRERSGIAIPETIPSDAKGALEGLFGGKKKDKDNDGF